MTKNWELFADDPRESTIPNLGVAKVDASDDDAGIQALRHELKTFVCDGAYREGLNKILYAYLQHVGSQQTAAWVSGFYGSGKSHLVKVLEHLWSDKPLPDGATPRGLVSNLGEINDLLVELDAIGKRNGGRLAAAGSLLNGPQSVNVAFATVLLRAVGLPTDVAAARCILWMVREGIHDTVLEYVLEQDLDWTFVLSNMHVSELAEGILEAKPGWAASPDMARNQLWNQFPHTESVDLPSLLELVDAVLQYASDKNGKYPATLIVLDEMQAFLNDDAARAGEVQGLIEACQTRFDGLLFIVATGQSALSATPTLQKLTDRFNARQQLSDNDVDQVVRQVVLMKRPDRTAELQVVLNKNVGEIDRELGGAAIAPHAGDASDLVADYPILPSRRRFWEKALQAVDHGGTAGQLRSQLRMVHEAVRSIADDEIGTVVAADFLYGEQEPGMIMSGVLLREVRDLIAAERGNGANGPLRSRILSLVFLISRLSREGFADTGVRATPDHISDLLVDDLSSSGQALRKIVPTILEELRGESKLSLVDGEYILQSKTGQEWNQDYKNRVAAYKADLARVATDRDTLVRKELEQLIPRTFLQGASKTPRPITVHFGTNAPSISGDVPVWVRTGWETSEAGYQATASAAPTDSAVIHVFIPKLPGDDLTDAMASRAGGADTIAQRIAPTTNEGQEAKKAIQSIVTTAEAAIKRLSNELTKHAIVRQAGGTPVSGTGFTQAVENAVQKSLDRLYPKFSVADSSSWHLVLSHAVAGKPDALGAVGHIGEAAENAVCKEILATIPAHGAQGSEIRTKLTAPPHGWPRDAIDGAIAILLLAGNINAQLNGADIAASELKSTSIGKTVFRKESVTLDMSTRLKARGVLAALGISFTPNEEAPACSVLSSSLDVLLRSAGGESPLPAPMSSELIDELKSRSGAELVQFVAHNDSQLKDLAQNARTRAGQKDNALKSYRAAEALVAQLPSDAAELRDQLEAVAANRGILDSPDPVAPIVATATELLRDSVSAQHALYAAAVADALTGLQADASWSQLTDAQRSNIVSEQKLIAPPLPGLGTTELVLTSLVHRPLGSWEDLFAALPSRVAEARDRARVLLEPEAVKVPLPNAILKTQGDVDAYVEKVHATLSSALVEHKSIVI
ncbi:BREX system P-loop protein BrxC [Agromyces fucosus]|uniref:BREX system P-loop protein BrxC n=1 Tax=Agromyces fucosus TaxID=41985 RepID=A0A4Q2JN56_9MICO|nr:BREX system P-loop protein BrxC [Agromyces fucosus]RXZ47570.1 BREX system P-loop protein BrxC [Agromyces fucosus]